MNKVLIPHGTGRHPFSKDFFEHILSVALSFIKKNTVLIIAATLAVISCMIVKPDSRYLSYYDLKTLTCLFCTLAVICVLKDMNFFTLAAKKIVTRAGSVRTLALFLVYITFIGSMFIANDMALITFLPLGYIALASTGNEKHMAMTFILQNVAANLGGMLTPFGNPQNLYLYSKFNIPTGEFMAIMTPPFVISIILFTLVCLFFPKTEMTLKDDEVISLNKTKTVFALVLFALTILTVFRVIPYWLCLIITIPGVLLLGAKSLLKVDYPLLLTFVSFFTVAGNVARIDAVKSFFSSLLQKSTLLTSVLSCQVISNVPSAILLSGFTDNYKELLLGVNIGGVGTLIASLASLITFREYTKHNKGKALSYVGLFSVVNLSFLIVLTAAMIFII